MVETGYLSRDYTWNLKEENISKLSYFRLKDNYLHFYLKNIEPYKNKIARNEMNIPSNMDTIMGLQFENLLLNNRTKIKELLHLQPQDIILDNPYFQNKTNAHAGCQIDYLIQTKYNSLHLCEIKFSKNPITLRVVEQVKRKMKALSAHKKFSLWPVLIHVNGVTQEVIDADFFQKSLILEVY